MNLFSKKRIFLDYAGGKDNPSAIYTEGVETKRKLEEARTKVAQILHVGAKDVIFTSGGTESDNLAILGVFESHKSLEFIPHIIISSVEHPAITETAKEVLRRGGEVSIIKPDEEGRISPEEVVDAIKENTVLVSISLVTGETGIIQPIGKIGRMIREYRKERETKLPYLHTDASQAANLLDLNTESLRVDLLTLDSSKVLGPRSVGCLIVRPNVSLRPIIFGGGQERGLRSGTENVVDICKFSEALNFVQKDKEKEFERLNLIRKYFIEEIKKKIPNVVINGSEEYALPSIVNMHIPNTLAEFVAIKLDQKGIAVSVGSACNSRKNLSKDELDISEKETLRFSFGRYTTKKDIMRVIQAL